MDFDVPLVDLSAVNTRQVRDAAVQRISSIATVDAPWIDGPEVAQFEERWADYVGARYCVGVGNGTDALELAVRGALGPHDLTSVRLAALTFVATAEAVVRAGEAVELIDVDPVTLLARDEVDVAVGLYGQPIPADSFRENVSAAVVDAAQMHGLRFEAHTTAAWSFYPTKNLGAWGDAGAVTTDDEGLAQGIRELARHGGGGRTGVGFNSRLDTVQAAVLIEKLPRLDQWVEQRRQAVGSYQRRLAAFGLDVVGDWKTSACHQCVVRVPHRDRVRVEMGLLGIETGIHYGRALSEMVWLDPFRADSDLGLSETGRLTGARPEAERAAAEVLSLPLWPGIFLSTIERVCGALVESVNQATTEES